MNPADWSSSFHTLVVALLVTARNKTRSALTLMQPTEFRKAVVKLRLYQNHHLLNIFNDLCFSIECSMSGYFFNFFLSLTEAKNGIRIIRKQHTETESGEELWRHHRKQDYLWNRTEQHDNQLHLPSRGRYRCSMFSSTMPVTLASVLGLNLKQLH